MGLLEKARQMREKLEKKESEAKAEPAPQVQEKKIEIEKKEQKKIEPEEKVEEKPEAKKPGEKSEIEASAEVIITDIDRIYDYVIKNGAVKMDEITAKFKISKEKAEQWANLLSEHKLLQLMYPAMGSPMLFSPDHLSAEKEKKEKEKKERELKKKK